MADKTEHHQHKAAARKARAGHSAGAANPDATGPELATGTGEAAAEPETGKSGFANPLEFLQAELDRIETEKAELHDRLMRAAAEMENLRRRTARDVADAREYSIAAFAREMLAVSDNLHRALEAVPREAREAGDSGLNALIEGVELTERAMLQALEKHGVRRISPQGERFDPHFHQAMFEIQDSEVPANTVLQVVQDGYVIGERMLRPALVGVSRGGPRQPAKPEEDAEDQAAAGEGK